MTQLKHSAPWILKAFVVFSIIALIAEISIFTPLSNSSYNISLHTGVVYLFPYLFGLFFAGSLCYKPVHNYHVALLRIMIAGSVCGIGELILTRSPNYYPFQPLLAVVLPMVWYALLNTPSVRKYTETTQEVRN